MTYHRPLRVRTTRMLVGAHWACHRLCVLLVSGALLAGAQTKSSEASTKGSCSPAIIGNSNQITVSCTGLSKEKAEELAKMLNVVIQKQLDPKRVYEELDKISSSVRSLDLMVNPGGYATPAQKATFDRASSVFEDCSTMLREWTEGYTSALNSVNDEALKRMQAQTSAAASTDTRFVNEYNSQLANRVQAWHDKVVSMYPALVTTNAPLVITDFRTLGQLTTQLSNMLVSLRSSTAPIVSEGKMLQIAFTAFTRNGGTPEALRCSKAARTWRIRQQSSRVLLWLY